MVRLSRRHLLASAAGFCTAVSLLPACCFFRKLIHHPCVPPSPEEWKAAADAWWKGRREVRERQRAADRAAGRRPDVPFPRPWLACGKVPGSRGSLGDQVRSLSPGFGGDVIVTVTNGGNVASWSCCVDLYEGPRNAAGRSFSEMNRSDRKIIAVQPGAKKEVVLRWQGTQELEGFLIARCYDPLLDPAGPEYRIQERKSEGAAWRGGGG